MRDEGGLEYFINGECLLNTGTSGVYKLIHLVSIAWDMFSNCKDVICEFFVALDVCLEQISAARD